MTFLRTAKTLVHLGALLALALQLAACAHSNSRGSAAPTAAPAAVSTAAFSSANASENPSPSPNIAAAAAPAPTPSPAASTAASGPSEKLETEFADALTAPLADLNLVRKAIPPVLLAARLAPYAPPPDGGCAGLAAAIEDLDRVLGADLDSPPGTGKPSLLDRGSDLATQAVVNAVRDTTTGILPFRGWIRRLTGADQYAKEAIAAISAGAVRRAYLKGLGQAAHCPEPASPHPAPVVTLTPAPTPSPAPFSPIPHFSP